MILNPSTILSLLEDRLVPVNDTKIHNCNCEKPKLALLDQESVVKTRSQATKLFAKLILKYLHKLKDTWSNIFYYLQSKSFLVIGGPNLSLQYGTSGILHCTRHSTFNTETKIIETFLRQGQ